MPPTADAITGLEARAGVAGDAVDAHTAGLDPALELGSRRLAHGCEEAIEPRSRRLARDDEHHGFGALAAGGLVAVVGPDAVAGRGPVCGHAPATRAST